MVDLNKLTPLEDTYLENTTSRNAFYHVKLFEVGTRFYVGVTYGSVGKLGRTILQGTYNTLLRARSKMSELESRKLLKSYKRAIKQSTTNKNKAKSDSDIVTTKTMSLSRFTNLE